MSYNPYPYWTKHEADRANSRARQSEHDANECKEKLQIIHEEIVKYKRLESDKISIKELTLILDKISGIISA